MGVPPNHPSHWTVFVLKPWGSILRTPLSESSLVTSVERTGRSKDATQNRPQKWNHNGTIPKADLTF